MKSRLSILLLLFFVSMTSVYSQTPKPTRGVNGKWGYQINSQWVIEPKYDAAQMFSESLACVKLFGKYGYVNQYGDTVIPFEYEGAGQFSNGMASVKKMEKWGYVDKDANIVIPYKYDEAYAFSCHFALVKLGGKYGFIDVEGKTVIPFKYDSAKSFSDGLACVGIGSQIGYIDYYGNWYEDKSEYFPKFSDYAKLYVEQKVNLWQAKGKYEKMDAWKKRVNENTKKAKVTELTKEAEKHYIYKEGKRIDFEQILGAYDTENEIFLVKDKRFGNLLVPVSITEAQEFENNFYQSHRSVKFFVENDTLALAELRYTINNGKSYTYSNSASLDYFITNVDYDFAPIELDYTPEQRRQGKQRIIKNALKSDVDKDIPKTKAQNDDTYAVIIANENYKYEASVPYAKADGAVFKEYCMSVLGIPENRIEYCEDATLNDIRRSVSFLKNASLARGGDAKVIFYYSGHGIPDDSSKKAYLLPCDGTGSDTSTGYELSNLYSQLGDMPVKNALVFIDACFSGAKREGDMILASKAVAIKPIEASPLSGNVIVLSASQGDQTAIQYMEKGHGLFTYYLLKKLKDSRGQTSLGALFEYVSENVNTTAIDINRKPQHPSVMFSPDMNQVWQDVKLRN